MQSESPVPPIAESPECGTDPRFAKTRFVVEANTFEVMKLHQEHRDREWKQDCSGLLIRLGKFGGMPVNICFQWYEIDGVLVAFWDAISMVTHSGMVDEWFKANCAPRWANGKRDANADAMNFHLCLDAIDEINAAPVPSAPPVDESDGPRWKSILLGFEPYKFIARIDAYDGYLVTCSRGLAIGFIAETGWSGFGWVYLDSAQKYFSETTGTHAELHKRLYDTALSANQLPPHPRWAKPTPECDTFLCWGEVGGESRDFWWGSDRRIHSVCEFNSGIADPESRDYAIFASGYQSALARARELRLPQRARIATLRAARDAATADLEAAERELREIGGGA